jgi:hypothetical protein
VTERPLFIDPVDVGGDGEVDDADVPRWFAVVALLILAVAAYYLATFLGGPRDSSPHNFQPGREVYEQVGSR